MTSKTWSAGSVIDSAWLQDVNNYVYGSATGAKRNIGIFASDIPGYDPTGVADSTLAINTACSSAVALGSYTVYITGTPRITGANPLPYTERLALVGIGAADDFFSNDIAQYAVRIKCGGVTGYVFDQPDVANGKGSLVLRNIGFDARVTGGTGRSTTCTGLVKATTTAGNSSFYLRIDSCFWGFTDSVVGSLMLTGEVFSRVTNCMFSTMPFGYGVQGGNNTMLGTTISFEKCYFTSMRQCYEFLDGITDITYRGCVFESSVVVGAAYKCNVLEDSCYHENIGYDASGTGITTGLTPRGFGVGDIPGNVDSAYTCRFGQIRFDTPTIMTTVGGMKWFDGIGRAAGGQNGGCFLINDLILGVGSLSTIFRADADVPSSRNDFEYFLTSKRGTTAVFTAADARMVTKGRIPIAWSDGNARPVEIDNGIFTLPALAVGGLTALPTIYPSGGAAVVGDVIKMAPSQYAQGVRSAYQCVVAGTAASRWNICDFIPSSLQATLGIAGTMVVTATANDNPGEEHVWEVMASAGANVESHYRVTMQAFNGTGQLSVQAIVTIKTLTFTMGWGGPYTITITNTSGVAGLVTYARLVNVSSTHT